jgi:hypothetical protein
MRDSNTVPRFQIASRRSRIITAVIAVAVALSAVTFAQANMSGEWEIEFVAPQGPQTFTMYVLQEGPRLTGRLTSDAGEFPLRGRINGAEFTITWSMPEGNQLLEITVTGKVDGDALSGTAKLGTRGSGPLRGTRTGQ